mmetsp:Transcript_15021/g.44226  ORF Transcript_15021/g.44226 Transcript_15021/m.44226 type:complete len:259 (+) Transcript_15021:1089-1865(+)
MQPPLLATRRDAANIGCRFEHFFFASPLPALISRSLSTRVWTLAWNEAIDRKGGLPGAHTHLLSKTLQCWLYSQLRRQVKLHVIRIIVWNASFSRAVCKITYQCCAPALGNTCTCSFLGYVSKLGKNCAHGRPEAWPKLGPYLRQEGLACNTKQFWHHPLRRLGSWPRSAGSLRHVRARPGHSWKHTWCGVGTHAGLAQDCMRQCKLLRPVAYLLPQRIVRLCLRARTHVIRQGRWLCRFVCGSVPSSLLLWGKDWCC